MQEHPLLVALKEQTGVKVYGVNYKDKTATARRFLGRYGNPFAAVGVDANGRAAIDWGVYGIPESYLVAPDGAILYKRVGPFDDISLKEGLLPAMAKALGTPAS